MRVLRKSETHLIDVEIIKIFTFDHVDYNQREIVDQIFYNQNAIEHTFHKYNFETFIKQKSSSHRFQNTIKYEDKYIIRVTK